MQRKDSQIYRRDIWNTGATRRSRPLLQAADHSKTSIQSSHKVGSCPKLTRVQGLTGGLAAVENFYLVSNGLLTLTLFAASPGLLML